MADILSQQEVDELVKMVMQSERRAATQVPAEDSAHSPPSRRIRVYDFRRPDKFSKDQIRTLQMLHDNYARLLTSYLSTALRTMVRVDVVAVEQLSFEEFLDSLPNPAVVAVVSMSPMKGNALLDLEPNLAFAIIDRLFGGPGAKPDTTRPLTDVEETVLGRILGGMLQLLAEAWRNIMVLEPKLQVIESNPLFAQVVSPGEMTVVVVLSAELAECEGGIKLCLPYITIEPALPKLSAQHWFTRGMRQEDAPEKLEELKRRLKRVEVPINVALGSTRLTVRELLNLRVGDVIRLDNSVDQDLCLYVGSRPKFWCRPGRVGPRLACRITAPIREEESEDE